MSLTQFMTKGWRALGTRGTDKPDRFRNVSLIWVAVALAAFAWSVSAMLQANLFESGPLSEQLFKPHAPELWSRLAMVCALLCLGIIGQRMLARRRRVEALAARYARILDSSWNEIYFFDAKSLRYVQTNDVARRNLGYSTQAFMRLTPFDLMPELDEFQFNTLAAPLRRGERDQVVFETFHRRADGTDYPVKGRLQLHTRESSPVFVAIVQDISERRAHLAQMQRRNMYDTLTDLPNRHLFDDRLGDAIAAARRETTPLALILLDVSHLRDIRDTLGHRSADRVLQQIGNRLQYVLRPSDTVARLGGGEFALALPAVDFEYAIEVAQRVRKELAPPFTLEEIPIHVDAHIGIVLFPEHGDDPDILLQRADVAVRQAKREKADYVIYNPARDPYSLRRLTLFGDLRHAINQGDFMLYYQPKVNIKTREVASVEALVRWRHPKEGVISPSEFIPLAEHTGLIKPLTTWVLNEAIRQCRACKQAGLNVKMAVNLSAGDLQQLHLPDEIAKSLAAWEVGAHDLVLEITESAIMEDPERALHVLARLDTMGVQLSIDDFGTGYSSLAYLKKLPASELKIDQSFIKDMAHNSDDATIVHSIIALAHSLGLKVVAEGIETAEVLEVLGILGCDTAQGSYMSPPLPSDKLIVWVKAQRFTLDKVSYVN